MALDVRRQGADVLTARGHGRRLTLNMLLSFAQFEREIAGERIRDKIAASNIAALRSSACTRSHPVESLNLAQSPRRNARHPTTRKWPGETRRAFVAHNPAFSVS